MPDILNDLEDYLASMQRLELQLSGDNAQVNKIVQKHAVKPAFYTGVAEINLLQKELEAYLESLTAQTGKKGKLMATKAMDRFLESAERRQITDKTLASIDKLNARNVERRIDIYKNRVLKETTYLKSEIKEFFDNGVIAGRSRKDVLRELVKAAGDGNGLSAGFAKKMRRVSIDSARREAQERSMVEYRKVALPKEDWQWVAVNSKPCPDCMARAGKILPLPQWRSMGVPGAGATICGFSCMCQLVPLSVSEELFPDVKEFHFDKKTLVLTTAGEARTLNSKRAQAPQG